MTEENNMYHEEVFETITERLSGLADEVQFEGDTVQYLENNDVVAEIYSPGEQTIASLFVDKTTEYTDALREVASELNGVRYQNKQVKLFESDTLES